MTLSAESWRDASIADGAEPEAARATIAFYTGVPAPGEES